MVRRAAGQKETKPKPNEYVNEYVNGDGDVSGSQANAGDSSPKEKLYFFADID